MLEMLITQPGGESSGIIFGLDLAATSNGALTCYSGHLYSTRKDEIIINNYPRWSEPAGALCTRMFAKALRATPSVGRNVELGSFEIVVRLLPFGRDINARILEQYEVKAENDEFSLTLSDTEMTLARAAGEPGSRAALRILKQIYWRSDRVPPARPIYVPVHESDQGQYIRISEIPEPAQSAFRLNISRSSRPYISGIHDAAYAYDWSDFLEGTR